MEFKELFDQVAQRGRVAWIGVRPERKAELVSSKAVFANSEKGLEGDRYKKKDGSRQVTLIQKEHLKSIAAFLGRDEQIGPELVRRNLVIEGLNLISLKGKQFHIGEVILEFTGECHPCSRMEENLGVGGYNAMRGMGGITAKIIKSGTIHVNDEVFPI